MLNLRIYSIINIFSDSISPLFSFGLVIDAFNIIPSKISNSTINEEISLDNFKCYFDLNNIISYSNLEDFTNIMNLPFHQDEENIYSPQDYIINPFSLSCNFVFNEKKRINVDILEIYESIKRKLNVNDNISSIINNI